MGKNDDTAIITNSYWDKTVNSDPLLDNGYGTGKTTAEMMMLSTFVGWDISNLLEDSTTWYIDEGAATPVLRYSM